ncbi:MAG TPA: VOC family protein [Candidatus Sulfotelmatobacter sp.]|nr:VOC family protein [Candidatus Sulfotelmatobacter sp.]
MGRVVHFEITADDVPRAKKFYEIFDWDIKDSGMPELGENKYMVAKTGKEGDTGTDGAIMSRSFRADPTIIWIAVDDIDQMAEKVKASGGQVAGKKQTVPGVGDTIYIKDTEGNTVGLIQPLPRQ